VMLDKIYQSKSPWAIIGRYLAYFIPFIIINIAYGVSIEGFSHYFFGVGYKAALIISLVYAFTMVVWEWRWKKK
jgi:hypothetical protein